MENPPSKLALFSVSPDSQVLFLYAKSGSPFLTKTETEGSKDKTCSIGTADLQLGRAIVKAITTAVECANMEPPPVFTESTPYSLIIKRYLTKELNRSPHIELQYLALAYWKESSACLEKQHEENVGYLYRRMVPPYWWRKPPAEWFQSYFVLKGSKMYVFTDSTCKEGEMVINLRDCTELLEMDSKKDCQWGFELVLPDGNLQLQCPSKDEMNKWMQLVNEALNALNDDDAVACMVIITDTNSCCCPRRREMLYGRLHSHFSRKCFLIIARLLSFPLPDIRSGWVVQTETHMVLLLRVDAMYQWFFFRSKDELNRIVRTLSIYPIPLTEVNQNSQEKAVGYILNECGKIPDLWHKAIFATEGFELEP
ncbi:PH domain protein [Cooperia oncophora]